MYVYVRACTCVYVRVRVCVLVYWCMPHVALRLLPSQGSVAVKEDSYFSSLKAQMEDDRRRTVKLQVLDSVHLVNKRCAPCRPAKLKVGACGNPCWSWI